MDTFSRAGSCCQIGENCHISAGSGIGGVLEPAQALPTIIEDNVFCATGITSGELVDGVKLNNGKFITETLVTHKNSMINIIKKEVPIT